jgi:hypothetical protein
LEGVGYTPDAEQRRAEERSRIGYTVEFEIVGIYLSMMYGAGRLA